ncbi:SsgA family sporulation/cell division regulator [Streptacidiphilus melanogenes]|uniref:SsgA family sporulation/cell division regulator n=1 Tax=Streptacidiphilus melanogenes TaxID=411235 RepID=UPI0006944C35|nr:SsgA family sporulation/cell division regulator [Streptacidiphilus melanogenes]
MDLQSRVAVSLASTMLTTSTVECTLLYTTDDPYAVHMRFPPVDSFTKPVVWSFSRELLNVGLNEPTGLGDVRLEPSDSGRIGISLRGSTGHATLSLRATQLRRFLEDTELLVPSGTEAEFIDWDHLAQQLTSPTS